MNIRKSNREIERIIFKLVNKERSGRGLKELSTKPYLIRAAIRHSRYMVKRHHFAHTTRRGYEPWNRVKKSAKEDKSLSGIISRIFGISTSPYVGENIGMMPIGRIKGMGDIRTEEDVARAMMTNWMKSPGHRKNILNPNFKRIGVGVACKRKGKHREYYATQDFQG